MLRVDTYDALREQGFAKFHVSELVEGERLLDEFSKNLKCEVFSSWHTLSPTRESEASPVSYSGRYGLGHFPMHSDLANWKLPPRFLILWAEIGSEGVFTPLMDCFSITSTLEVKALARALVKPRRPVQGKLPLMRLYENIGHPHALFRWDPVFLKPASPAGMHGINLMAASINRSMAHDVCLAQSGDGIIIDNWRMLHGRSAVDDSNKQRLIRRAYLGAVV